MRGGGKKGGRRRRELKGKKDQGQGEAVSLREAQWDRVRWSSEKFLLLCLGLLAWASISVEAETGVRLPGRGERGRSVASRCSYGLSPFSHGRVLNIGLAST